MLHSCICTNTNANTNINVNTDANINSNTNTNTYLLCCFLLSFLYGTLYNIGLTCLCESYDICIFFLSLSLYIGCIVPQVNAFECKIEHPLCLCKPWQDSTLRREMQRMQSIETNIKVLIANFLYFFIISVIDGCKVLYLLFSSPL